MSQYITNVTDQSFKTEVLDATLPVLVDFWAEWCGPCRAIAPTLEDIAKTYEGKVKVVKINIDENPQTPEKYAIRLIPTLLLVKEGHAGEVLRGAVSKSELAAFLDSHI